MTAHPTYPIPPHAQWGQRQGLILPRTRRPTGPNGGRLCRWCDTECPPPKSRRWCSRECLAAYEQVWDWKALRGLIIRRDQETCRLCGTRDPEPRPRYWMSRWDVDHIVRVADGGTDDPTNLRLLCWRCHKGVTAGLAPSQGQQVELALGVAS